MNTSRNSDPSSDMGDPPALVVELARDHGGSLIPVGSDKVPLVPWKEYQVKRPSIGQLVIWQVLLQPVCWGVVTGAVSGRVGLDFDGERGLETLAELGFEPHVTTPSGGAHVHFDHPGVSVRTRALVDGQRWPSMDVRGDGGFLIVWGSTSNGEYAWHDREPYAWSELPAELSKALTGTPSRTRTTSRTGRRVPDGERHSHLLSLGGKLIVAEMAPAAVEAAMVVENENACDPLMAQVDVRRLAKDLIRRYGDTLHTYALTDLGNAERFADRYCDELRHVVPTGWYRWDGRRWCRDQGDVEVVRCATAAVRSQRRDLPEETDDNRKARRQWAHQSESRPRIEAAIKSARALPSFATSARYLDADRWLLNVLNGTIDLHAGGLKPHDRADLITKLAPVDYDPDARSERWEGFLERITDGDLELRTFLQRLAGYTAAGVTDEEILSSLHGPGATGKSTFVEAIKAVLGDYAATADFETFLARRGDAGVRNDIARLAGTRMVVSIEVEDGKHLAEGLIKQLTGGDTVTARFLYQEAFEFVPAFTLWLVANARPRVNADDEAIWRRIVQVPFTVVIPPAERDPELKRALRSDPSEQRAILAWIVQGCLDWQQHGLGVPSIVRDYTAQYRTENDPIARWLGECCAVGEGGATPTTFLRPSWEQWWDKNGENERRPNWLRVTSRLKELGCIDGRMGGHRCWHGIQLTSSDAGDADDAS